MIELVIVLAIIGVLGAIAVPRLTSVAESAPLTAYKADLVAIQNAVERYAAEYLGKLPDSDHFVLQLTQFTDIHGNVSPVKTTTHLYGPYLRRMPEVYVGPRINQGDLADANLSEGIAQNEVAIRSTKTTKETVWLYNPLTGQVRVQVASVDGVKLAEP